MQDGIYVHRAVIVPGKRGGRVFSSIAEAPLEVRRVFDRGSVVTIVIAERGAKQRLEQTREHESGLQPSHVPSSVVREVSAAVALIGAIFYFAVSR